MELYTKKGKNTLSLVGVSDGGEPLQKALSQALLSISTGKSIKNKRDLMLLIGEFDQRVTMAIQNQVCRRGSRGTVHQYGGERTLLYKEVTNL